MTFIVSLLSPFIHSSQSRVVIPHGVPNNHTQGLHFCRTTRDQTLFTTYMCAILSFLSQSYKEWFYKADTHFELREYAQRGENFTHITQLERLPIQVSLVYAMFPEDPIVLFQGFKKSFIRIKR